MWKVYYSGLFSCVWIAQSCTKYSIISQVYSSLHQNSLQWDQVFWDYADGASSLQGYRLSSVIDSAMLLSMKLTASINWQLIICINKSKCSCCVPHRIYDHIPSEVNLGHGEGHNGAPRLWFLLYPNFNINCLGRTAALLCRLPWVSLVTSWVIIIHLIAANLVSLHRCSQPFLLFNGFYVPLNQTILSFGIMLPLSFHSPADCL